MNSMPEFCEEHKSSEHTNLVHQTCVVCSVLDIVDHEGRCSTCSDYLNKRLHLRKQRLVRSWILGEPALAGFEIYDRPMDGGVCGKERPDFMWDVGTHRVFLEKARSGVHQRHWRED